MITQEDIAQEYTLSKYGQMSDLYNAMCAEIASLRNLAYDAATAAPATLDTLHELEHKKTVFVKVRGKRNYEQHEYSNNAKEDNATIINNVKKQLKEDGIIADVVFVAEKI